MIDRWIYVFTAASIIAFVLAGFVPDSFAKLAAIDAGKRPPFRPILHVHAVLMACFLLLLLAQTALVAVGKRRWHMQIGIAGAFFAAAILVSGIVLVSTAPPGVPIIENILLLQLRSGILFPLFIWIALQSRIQDPGLHKRLMILSITTVLAAATVRIRWLPTTFPHDALTVDFFTMVPFIPMFMWDLIRNRRLHRSYQIWAAFFVPVSVAIYIAWDTPWWHTAAHHIIGG